MHSVIYLIILIFGFLFPLESFSAELPPRPSGLVAKVSLIAIGGKAVDRSEKVRILRPVRGSRTYDNQPAEMGDALEDGSRIETPKDAQVSVESVDRTTRIYLAGGTTATIASGNEPKQSVKKKTESKIWWRKIILGEGRLWIQKLRNMAEEYRNHFDAETDGVSAYSEGTEYYVGVDEKETTYFVYDGIVRLRNRLKGPWDELTLKKGQIVILGPGQTPDGPRLAKPGEVDSAREWKNKLEKLISR